VRAWIEIQAAGGPQRHELRRGLTKLGGPGADVALAGWSGGELHFWDDPPKVVHVGGPILRHRGSIALEADLADGERLEWGGATIVYREAPVLEELAPEVAEDAPPTPLERRTWRRVQAGLLVDLGLADGAAARRWQDAVRRGDFDPDAASRELVVASPAEAAGARLCERAGTLLRDFLMAPLARGAPGVGRRARGAAKSGLAFALAQVLALAVYSALLAAAMILARARWETSFDGWIDALLGG
jgi:hypothetical protein